MKKILLSLKNISKNYITHHNKEVVRVLDDVSIDIYEGEFISIIGSSGSGKSTFLNIMGGITKPSSGEVYFKNNRLDKMSYDSILKFRVNNIGFIFQKFNLIDNLNVYENVILPLELENVPIDNNFVNEILMYLELFNKKDYFINELSGGEEQRVAIARALVSKYKVILADEPTGSLDPKNAKMVVDLLKLFVSKFGITVVMVTHDINLTIGSDRLFKIENGKVYEGFN